MAGGDSHAPPPREPRRGADRGHRGGVGAAPLLDRAWYLGCRAAGSEPVTGILTDPEPVHNVGVSTSSSPRPKAGPRRAEACGTAQSGIAISACGIHGQSDAPGIGCERGGLPEAARNAIATSDARLGSGAIRGRSPALGDNSDACGGKGPAAGRHGDVPDSHESARKTKRLCPVDVPVQASATARLEALRRRVVARSLRTGPLGEEARCDTASGGGQMMEAAPSEEADTLADGADQRAARATSPGACT